MKHLLGHNASIGLWVTAGAGLSEAYAATKPSEVRYLLDVVHHINTDMQRCYAVSFSHMAAWFEGPCLPETR